MVTIRLTRTGKKHAPVYRIIAIQKRTKRDGEALEYLGTYNPRTNPSTITVDKERVQYWISQGAQPSTTVKNILIKEGIIEAPAEKKVYSKQPGRKKQERMEAAQQKEEATKAEAEKAKAAAETKAEETAPETKEEEKSE